VKPGWNIPLNAVLLTFAITCLLSLIDIGSTVAFEAIGSLALVAILGTYMISITIFILRRFMGAPSTAPVEHGQAGDLRQHWCGGLAFDGLGVLLFPRFHSGHTTDDELECRDVRWNLSYWTGLLVHLGQEGVQAARLPCLRETRESFTKKNCWKPEERWVFRSQPEHPLGTQRSERTTTGGY
jgi:hypothetical protein